uniref:Nucleotidyltransferase n=1 Tax=Ignisphaera aggregans TaxID=334771 RepID=A0A7C4H5F9_9CREN
MITYTIKHVAKVLKQLKDVGIEGIIIGSTCLSIALGNIDIEGDIDLFTTSISPFFDEERIRQIAYQKGWSTGTTELGTPSIILNVEGIDITVELYENILDFYIPSESIDICRQSIEVDGTEITYVAVECWIVFKARRGSDRDILSLSTIKQFVDEGVLPINKTLLEKMIELYEDDKRYIYNRLKNLNLI